MKSIHAQIDIHRSSGFHLETDIEIKHGEITALYGPSGSGKSSVLRIIAGLDHLSNGVTVKTDTETWNDSNVFVPTHLRGIGYVFQHAQLFPHLSVEGNLQYAIARRHQQTDIELEQVKQWLGIDSLLKKPISQLSGGELQRVSIARVLLNGAKALLMDEPLGALDQQARRRILPYIDELHDRLDFPFLYVSHAIEEVTYLADKIYLLEEGSVRNFGSTFEISSSIELNAREGDAAAAMVQCEIVSFDYSYNLTQLDFEGQRILVSGNRRGHNRTLKVRIPARDVSLTLGKSEDSSILNILSGQVEQIVQSPEDTSALVRIKVGQQVILSRITRRSLDKLQIKEGQQVFAQIKSVGLLSDYGS
ncbi:MAG: molybdenum ABC transporter ATP-binding protein [bacterium]